MRNLRRSLLICFFATAFPCTFMPDLWSFSQFQTVPVNIDRYQSSSIAFSHLQSVCQWFNQKPRNFRRRPDYSSNLRVRLKILLYDSFWVVLAFLCFPPLSCSTVIIYTYVLGHSLCSLHRECPNRSEDVI